MKLSPSFLKPCVSICPQIPRARAHVHAPQAFPCARFPLPLYRYDNSRVLPLARAKLSQERRPYRQFSLLDCLA